ncbi:MAG: serine/threonine-protein kinase [Pirellulales bacterium]
MAIPTQQRVGPYRLVGLIRAGHACEIWKVQRGGSDARWAMKLLRRGAHFVRAEVALLKHEFSVGRALEHASVIRVHDFDATDAGAYLVMDLYPFPNLKQRINEGVVGIAPLAATIVREAAGSLDYLHQQGWIHCDVKPDNFLVSDEGHVKLIDFSLAQRRKGKLGRLFSGRMKVQGTKSYMSPEQIRGQSVDERSDVYCFGCVLHEIATGKVPFTGVSANDLLTKHLKSKPGSITAISPDVDPAFAQLVGRMMAKDPERRPGTMQAFLEELGSSPIFRRRPAPPEVPTDRS